MPEIDVRVGRAGLEHLPAALAEALQRIEVHQSDGDPVRTPDGFQLTFTGDAVARDGADLALLGSSALATGARVSVSASVHGMSTVLFVGVVTHRQVLWDEDTAQPELVVTGRDLGVLLDLREWFRPIPASGLAQVVGFVLAAHAADLTADITVPASDWLARGEGHHTFQQGTDLEYLRALAATCGGTFAVLPGTGPGRGRGRFGPADLTGQPALDLVVGGPAPTVRSIAFGHDALAARTAAYQSFDADTTASTGPREIRTSADWTGLGTTSALAATNSLRGTALLPTRDLLPGSRAASAAQGIVDRNVRQAVVARCTVDLLVHPAVVRAPSLARVIGAGHTFDGRYYLGAVKHIIDTESHVAELTLQRGAVGGGGRV
jgi:hypothetical protein